jgi:hypothetical protein
MRCSYVLFLFSLLFQFGCGQAPAEPAAGRPSLVSLSGIAYSKSFDVDLTASHLINSATIAISNRGSDSVIMPAVFVKGGAGLNRSSILSSIRSAGPLTDEQFALATWSLVSQHNHHYCSAGAPGDAFNDAEDPMRLLHGYGFTCCDQSTDILVWIWRGAGYQARAARMAFHEVPEIYYHDAWHAYDADHKVYYLARDNATVASVADVIEDSSLVASTADADGNDPVGYSAQWMAEQYAAATPAYDHSTFSEETTYSLRSSQTFTLRSENPTTSIFHGPSADEPLGSDAVNSGQFDWELDFARPNWKNLTNSLNGVGTLTSGTDTFLTNTSTSPGYVIYHLSSPFPVFNLMLSGMVYRQDSTAAVNAYLLHDGSHWSTAFPMIAEVGSPHQTTADLTSAAVGQYSYFVMLQLSGSAPDVARIAAVHITAEVQVAKMLFPNLVPGTINHLTYQDWIPLQIVSNRNGTESVGLNAAAHSDVEISVTVQ